MGRGLGVGGGRVADGVGVGDTGVGVGVGVTGVGVGVIGVGVGVIGVGVGVGVGVTPPGQLPFTLNTIIMFGNPISCVGVGTVTPQSAALK